MVKFCGKHIQICIFLLATTLGLVFSFVVIPHFGSAAGVVMDPDGYGALGKGLYINSTFAFFPNTEPTVSRGPIYPIFIYLCLLISGGLYPYSIQIAQSLLFGTTCVFVYWIAYNLFSKRIAVISSLICAVHPLLIWYTPRIWIEVLATFLFTAIAGISALFWRKPNLVNSIILGAVIGIASLCKETFLPFVVIIPILFAIIKKVKIKFLAIITLSAVIIIAPWTIRNYKLTRKFIPVHLLAGLNIQMGDSFAENYFKHPLSYKSLWNIKWKKMHSTLTAISDTLPRYRYDAVIDSVLIRKSLQRYKKHPEFILRKIILNSIMFWTLGQTPAKSIVISSLQMLLLILFILATAKVLRKQPKSIYTIHIAMVWLYFIFHLPIFAFARLSVVLIPTMVIYSVAGIAREFRPPPLTSPAP